MAVSQKLGSSKSHIVTGDPRWGEGLVLRPTNQCQAGEKAVSIRKS